MSKVVVWKTSIDAGDRANRVATAAMNWASKGFLALFKPQIFGEGVNEGDVQRAFTPWAERTAREAIHRGRIGPQELDSYRSELDHFDNETLRLFMRLVTIQGEKSARFLTSAMVRLKLGDLGALIKEES